MKKTLFEIQAEVRALEEVILEAGGDITDEETEKIIDDWFAEIKTNRDEKLDNYAALIRMLEVRADVRKAESTRLLSLAKPDLNLAKRLKERLKFYLEVTKEAIINTNRYRFSMVNNGGSLPVHLDQYLADHPEELPEGYRRVVFEPDLVKIREALERGEKLEFAQLGERGKSLRIK